MPPAQHYPPQPPPPPPQQYMNRAQPMQQPTYRPQQGVPMPGHKRVKIEEEEEEEQLLPRDIAAHRFVRWTEWMEEILSSGYNIRIPSLLLNEANHIGDIMPPPITLESQPKDLIERTQALENEIRLSKQRHEETLQKFKLSCKVWKEGTKRLAMETNAPTQEVAPVRVDGVAAIAKDAELAISLAMTQPSHADEIEEINRQVLAECGVPNARVRKVQKIRPVGKHIDFEPVRKAFPPPAPPPAPAPVPAQPGPSVVLPVELVDEPVVEEDMPGEAEVGMESAGEEDGLANEAFEAMEAMDFDANEEFDFDSENHGVNDMTMDMGVD
jgi:Fungal domain of unknown function (DUF1750)